jgi:hypothetical protein
MQPAVRLMLKIVAGITLLIFALSIGLGSIPHSVHASPLSAPPDISVSGTCDGSGNATFTITNSGGDMPDVYTYEIFLESSLIKNGAFLLYAGDFTEISTSGTYGNIRMDIKDDVGTVITSETTTCVPPTEIPTKTPTATLIPPNLSISGTCDTSGNASFTISNSGGDMPDVYTYAIYQETLLITNGSFILYAGDTMDRTTSGTFGNIRMDIKNGVGTVVASKSTTCDRPTSTSTTTETSTNTPTPTSTDTSTPTETSTITPTPTSTNTPTPTTTITPTPTTTNTATSTGTYTTVPTHAPTSKPHSSGNDSVTSNFHYFWTRWLYTATYTPTVAITVTSTQTSIVTMTPNSAVKAGGSTQAAYTVTTIQPESSPVAGSPSDGSTILPWLGLGLILMGSFLSVIFFRLIPK